VGINGELVVNGKAVVDKLNAGDIHGGKIAADTLDANRLKAGSVTAREIGAAAVTADKIGANAVTADKIQVADLSAVSSNLGSITGGSLNIGGGNFTVSSDGILTADNAVIRGRIEADSGYFNGTVRASSVEGDVLRAHRLRWTEGNVWVLDLDKDPLPRVLIPNFYVVSETFGNNRVQAKLLLNGGVLAPREVRETENYTNYIWRGRTFGRYEDLPPPGKGGRGLYRTIRLKVQNPPRVPDSSHPRGQTRQPEVVARFPRIGVFAVRVGFVFGAIRLRIQAAAREDGLAHLCGKFPVRQ
ncbi:TPA: hypothetical protein ACOBZ8_001898, partial [Neisseria gonorrhoeae]